MRLLTRSDFDGLMCAVLLKDLNLFDEKLFVHPKDMQDGLIDVTTNDILVNIPYAPGCGMWFDHHTSAETAEGLTDVLRHFRPEPGEYTFFDYRVKDSLERNIGWRIDHILVSPSLAGQALDCFVERASRGWEKPSDHTPLVADFAF